MSQPIRTELDAINFARELRGDPPVSAVPKEQPPPQQPNWPPVIVIPEDVRHPKISEWKP